MWIITTVSIEQHSSVVLSVNSIIFSCSYKNSVAYRYFISDKLYRITFHGFFHIDFQNLKLSVRN